MLLKDFYRTVILTEETAVAFLRENNLLDTPQQADPCHRCGSIMQEKRKRDRGGEYRPIFRCPRKGCQTSRSVRNGNSFFHYKDINNKLHCNLSLCEILELVYFFVMEIPTTLAVSLTGKSSSTVSDWYNMCREVCGMIISLRARMADYDPLYIDEEKLSIRRKSSRAKSIKVENEDKAPSSEETDTQIKNEDMDSNKDKSEQKNEKHLSKIDDELLDIKPTILRKKGVSKEVFQLHLDHFRWKVLRKGEADLFVAFLNDIRSVYR